jgi:hypothetical protein
MFHRLRAVGVLMLGAVSLQACIYRSLGDFCSGSDSDPTKIDSSSLEVVLGAPANRFADSLPFIMLYTPSQAQPQATLHLKLTPAPLPWPDGLDETPCKGIDWRTYRVAVDPDQWARFWALPRPLPVEGGIAFENSMAPLRMNRVGIALLNSATTEVLMSCGCYHT